MKKILILIIMLFTLLACSNKTAVTVNQLNTNYREDLIATNLFPSDANFLDEATLENLKIKVEDFEFIDVYTANSADDPSMFIVAKANEGKLDDCKGQIQYYLDNRMSAYKDYNPEAAEMIDNCLDADFDNYIIRVISKDNDSAKELIVN